MGLKGGLVVVTGGAGGIAAETAPLLLEDGADLCLIDPDEAGLARVVASLDAGGRVTTAASALESPEACAQALASLERPIYALVHLAGVFRPDTLEAASRPIWDEVMAANLTNAFDMIAACQPRLDPAVTTRILLVSSLAFRRGSVNHIAYTAAKGGIVGLVRALARKLAPATLVNGLAPGIIEPGMPAHLIADEQTRKRLIAETCLKRFGQPQEVASVIRFLLGPGATYITSQVINIDGGVVNS
jgi:3-oxoacyl-[acyl-carrier protein] reductase